MRESLATLIIAFWCSLLGLTLLSSCEAKQPTVNETYPRVYRMETRVIAGRKWIRMPLVKGPNYPDGEYLLLGCWRYDPPSAGQPGVFRRALHYRQRAEVGDWDEWFSVCEYLTLEDACELEGLPW